MKKCVIDDLYDLGSIMYKKASDGELIYAALFYDEATELMRILLDYDDVSVRYIDISEDEFDGYNKEYYVILDNDMTLNIEPAWHESNEWNKAGYLYFEADELYIDGAASYGIVKQQGNPECELYELIIQDTYDEDDDVKCRSDERDTTDAERLSLLDDIYGFISFCFRMMI